MKKVLLLSSMVILLFASSCKNESTTSTSKEPSKNENAVKEAYKAFETGDVSKMDNFLAEDCVDHNGGDMGGEIKGRENIKAFFTKMHNSFSDLKMTGDVMSEENGYVFSWVHMTGTTSATPDPSMHMPANTKVDMKSVDIVKFNAEGKATDHWGYVDPADMMKMTPGAMPPPATGTMTDTTKGKEMDTTKKK